MTSLGAHDRRSRLLRTLRWGPQEIGWQELFHLIWLVFLLFQPLFDPGTTAASWAFIPLVSAAFLPVYFWTWSQRGGEALPGIAILAAMGVLGAMVNTGASVFLIYAAAAAGAMLPTRRATWAIGTLFGLVVVAALVSGVPWPTLILAFTAPLVMVPFIGAINVFEAKRREADTKLRRAHDEVERMAAIAERERIARDLHDLLGHTLSVIVLKSELASKLAAAHPERAAEEIRDVERISRRALGEVREAVSTYRGRGLVAEVDEAREALAAARVGFRVDLPDRLPPARVEGILSLVVREALTNVVRHARASTCDVRLACDGAHWTLEVADDGHGAVASEGNGLRGIRERVEALGGTVELATDTGLRLVARVPNGTTT